VEEWSFHDFNARVRRTNRTLAGAGAGGISTASPTWHGVARCALWRALCDSLAPCSAPTTDLAHARGRGVETRATAERTTTAQP
jgi:hypothetical protein